MTDPGVTSSASTATSASATPRTSTTAAPVGDVSGSERRTSKEAAVLSEGVAGIALADALSATASGAVGPSVPITTTAAATTAAANSTATTTAGEDQADQDGTSSNNRCC